MKYKIIVLLLFVLTIIQSKELEQETQSHSEVSAQSEAVLTKQVKPDSVVIFNFIQEDLTNIINYIAGLKDVNVVLPAGTNKIDIKITISFPEKISLDKAWSMLYTILDLAGYSMVPKADFYQIIKNSPAVNQEPYEIYIATPIQDLPFSDKRIRLVHYLSNVRLTDAPDNEIIGVLKALLPISDPSNPPFKLDPATNAIVVTGKANDVKSVMTIINQLDKVGFQEKLEIVKLRHTTASTIANLFNEIMKSGDINRYRLDTQKQEASYFAKQTRIIPEDRTNALIILGKSQAVDRIVEFINRYIDVAQESGKSVLHVYQLQYLSAGEFAPVLQKVVASEKAQTAGQARAETTTAIGPERYFDEVIVAIDTPPNLATQTQPTPENSGATPTPYYGGNKLIVAANSDDWKRIEKLIQELDTPQPQVLIEVLVADLTVDDQRLLGTIFRNPARIPLPGETNFQSAMIQPGVIPNPWPPPTTNPQTIGIIENPDQTIKIAADLLRLGYDANGNKVNDGTRSAASFMVPGSTAIQVSDPDGQTYTLSQLLKLFNNTKILSHPHVIATNNKQAKVEIGQERFIPANATSGVGGTVRQNEKVKADLKVTITPRISPREDVTTVNLQVVVDINQFVTATSGSLANNTIITRNVVTNANVNSGDILALGGLIRVDTEQSINKTPVLADIPILGWLFKRRGTNQVKTNLTVFITPTIIQPRLRQGVSEYTRDYIALAKQYGSEGVLFDGLKDPITRLFFRAGISEEQVIDNFLLKNELDRVPGKVEALPAEIQPRKYCDLKSQTGELKELLADAENPFANKEATPAQS